MGISLAERMAGLFNPSTHDAREMIRVCGTGNHLHLLNFGAANYQRIIF
jgi:hypothetical protein